MGWEAARERRGSCTSTMDLTFVLSAAIFTLLAIVVATSLLSGSSSPARCAAAKPRVGHRNGPASGSDQAEAKHNGHAPEDQPQQTAADDWCDISGSAHDHWDVVKSVQSVSRALTSPLRHGIINRLSRLRINRKYAKACIAQ